MVGRSKSAMLVERIKVMDAVHLDKKDQAVGFNNISYF